MIVDFVVSNQGKTIYIDTKGFATEVSKLKYKILKSKLKDQDNVEVIWLHSKKEVMNYLLTLKSKENVKFKQSPIDW